MTRSKYPAIAKGFTLLEVRHPWCVPFRRSRDGLLTGFTLVELLVVISIISLLSSVVLTSVNSARSKARNAREKVDVKQIITALELARSNSANDKYPLSGSGGATWSCLKSSGSCWRDNYSAMPADQFAFLQSYLPTMPQTAVNTSGGSSCYAYDSYLYVSNQPSPVGTFTFSGGPSAFIIWAKETSGGFDPGECPGHDAGSYDCGLRYCYQFIGPN